MDRLEVRRKLLKQVKSQVEKKLGPTPVAIRHYAAPFEQEIRQKFRPSTKHELLRTLAQASVVYGADFHAFAQAQRTHLKLLRGLQLPLQRPLIIALEALPSGYDKEIGSYLQGRLSEKLFLQRVQWHQTWGFPWEHYRPLFELARERGFFITGLSPSKVRVGLKNDLKARDAYAAQIIKKSLNEKSQALVYIIFGELHLADTHLPQAVVKALKTPPRSIKIYLNCEPVYFALEKKKKTDLDVVKFNASTFCVLSSPPWVQWQSYLMFLDQDADDPLQEQNEEADFTDRVSAMIEVLCQDLGLRFKAHDLAVYTSQDKQLWNLLEQKLDRAQQKVAHAFVVEGKSFFLPRLGLAYLGRTAVNSAAELAGQYIHSKLCEREINFGEMPHDFERMIWVKAVGYYLSKLINPKRQAKTMADLQSELLDSKNLNESRQILSLALDQRMTEVIWIVEKRRRSRQGRSIPKSSYHQATRILGDMLGERLYLAVQSRRITRAKLMKLMRFDIGSESFHSFYMKLVAELEPVAKSMKNKKERL
jgi:hypothetical protein